MRKRDQEMLETTIESMSNYIENLKTTISSMREEILTLRKENIAFRKSISSAINYLKNSNSESRDMIIGKTCGSISSDSEFKPMYKNKSNKDKE